MKRIYVLHPFLFALFPVLFLYSHNPDLVSFSETIVPSLLVLVFALMFAGVYKPVFRDKHKAGICASVSLMLFFFYGRAYDAVRSWSSAAVITNKHAYLLFIWIILLIGSVYWLRKTTRKMEQATRLLNITAGALIVLSLVRVGSYKLGAQFAPPDAAGRDQTKIHGTASSQPALLSNIFYIILDGYAREDILKEVYGYDNREFLDYLTEKDFFVADGSRANYCQTCLSLASSLNYKYLGDIAGQLGARSDNRQPLIYMIRNSQAAAFLKQHGYMFAAFSSGYSGTEIRNADMYVTSGLPLDEFQNTLLNTTVVPAVMKTLPFQYDFHRKRILHTFERLVTLSESDKPVFAFAHIVAPHPPFVFDRNGKGINPQMSFTIMDGDHYRKKLTDEKEYITGYTEQLIFVNRRLRATIDGILSRSKHPPVIILQSDHGPGFKLNWDNPDLDCFSERLSIFSAYHLPGSDYSNFYEEMTPVNTFRMVFNEYFGTDLKLLPDESYFSTWDSPYAFIPADQ